MIVALAPEPAQWLLRLPEIAGMSEGWLIAPWALPHLPDALPIPGRVRAAWKRRTVSPPRGLRAVGVPAWPLLEASLRLVARSRPATFRTRFALRRGLGQLAALALPGALDAVVAPSLCAREAFAVARRRGARCILIEDLPSLRALNADLDEAAARYPDDAFLRNHRASAEEIARQEAERVLADALWVCSEHALRSREAEGFSRDRLCGLRPDPHVASGSPPPARGTNVVLLAGPAVSRSGVREALAAVEARPAWRLRIRAIREWDPALLHHPQVRVDSGAARTLEGVDAVLAPAWCESHPPELALAASLGIPIIATDRAAGFLPCVRVARGDVAGLIQALDAVRI